MRPLRSRACGWLWMAVTMPLSLHAYAGHDAPTACTPCMHNRPRLCGAPQAGLRCSTALLIHPLHARMCPKHRILSANKAATHATASVGMLGMTVVSAGYWPRPTPHPAPHRPAMRRPGSSSDPACASLRSGDANIGGGGGGDGGGNGGCLAACDAMRLSHSARRPRGLFTEAGSGFVCVPGGRLACRAIRQGRCCETDMRQAATKPKVARPWSAGARARRHGRLRRRRQDLGR